MDLLNRKIVEARKVYETYWESYTQGDLETFGSTLDNRFEMIGTSESERCHTKEDGIEFLKAQLHEVVGKAEMRDRQIDVVPLDNLVLINEQCDIYVLLDSEWNFYSKIRISTLLRETKEGWKVAQQHGSLPDMRVGEGETIALEKISKENIELRDAVKRRTAELENKNRELAIEAALERVRAQTMAMHSSEDVGKSVVKMFAELTALGVDEGTRFGIGILNHENENNQLWTVRKTGDEVNMHIGNIDMASHPLLKSARKAWKAQVPFHKYVLEGEDLLNYYRMLNNAPDYKIQIPLEKLPKREIQHCFIFEHGFFYAFSPREFQPELIQITKRFSSLFEQTYRRYLDLVRAEGQAREAEIELALERVRARTMAMYHSGELSDVGNLLFHQLKLLGIHPETSWLWFIDLENDQVEIWTTHENKLAKPIQIDPHSLPTVQKEVEAWKNEVPTLQLKIPESEAVKTIKDFFGIDISHQKDIAYFHLLQIRHNYGFLGLGTWQEASEDEIKLYVRFAKVFEQTYTRFLDLQKAEAQAKEAKIEAALEKVRARTMAMQHSDELPVAANLLFQQVQNLGMPAWSAGYCTWGQDQSTVTCWMSSEGVIQPPFTAPTTEDWLFSQMRIGSEKGKPLHVVELGGEELVSHYQYMRTLPVVGEILDSIIASGHPLPTFQIMHQAYFSKGFLLFITYQPVPEAHDIFKRFTKVFDQTYTRFLDLQKAEAQAREAKIEVALEKVRSRTMGMQKSDELADVANVLFEEMNELVYNLWTCGFVLCEKDREEDEWWLSLEDGFSRGFFLPNVNDYAHAHLYEGWLKKDDFRTAQLEGDKLQEHYDWLMEIPIAKSIFDDMEAADMQRPEWQKLHAAYFSKGYLVIITREPCAEEAIFKRFAQVFDLTYTRFLDLQKAEAQAKEATKQTSLDRVRGVISSMRSAVDLELITPLIFKELTILGVPFIRCGVFIIQEKEEIVEAYLSSPEGNSLGALRLPFKASELTFQTVKAWRKGEVYRQHWNKEDFVQWINQLMEEDQIQDSNTYQGTAAPPESLDLHFVPFKQGMLYVGAVNPLEENELELVQALAKAFSIAYARYEDFVKLEQAKAEIESAMIELKATQSQLVQQEKLASLGQLTAGIAHEIKNPLNFVNNFSEVSIELVDEAMEERSKSPEARDESLVDEILIDIKSNLKKVYEHGSRANGIVTSMLQHSRGGTGKMEPTDLNALIREYSNLAFHGMRAGKNPIDVDIQFDLDPEITEVPLIKEDFTRVIINLCNNAFDAMRVKTLGGLKEYHPKLTVKTKTNNSHILISVADNGPGIPDDIKDKILQPFFTTKKGTEGTGLGLSITHDIVKAHGGELKVESKIGKGSEFIIQL